MQAAIVSVLMDNISSFSFKAFIMALLLDIVACVSIHVCTFLVHVGSYMEFIILLQATVQERDGTLST